MAHKTQRTFVNEMRGNSLARVRSRHLEHEAVAFKSNQSIKESGVEKFANLAEQDPELLKELSRKRSLKFKDPSRSQSQANPLNEMPRKAVKQVVTPAILKKDQEACKTIIDRIQGD